MIRLALAMVGLTLVLRLAGGPDAVSVLSGTVLGNAWQLLLGVAYALSHFAAVVLAPVLMGVGLVAWAFDRGRLRTTP